METSVESKRQPLSAKAMNPTHLNLREGERTSLVCPDCKRWRFVSRGRVVGHRSAEPEGAARPRTTVERRYRDETGTQPVDFGPRCRGSERRLTIDLPLTEWKVRHDEALAHTALRRSDSAERKPRPKVTPAVSQMPSLSLARSARDAHVAACPKCRTKKTPCQVGAYLTVRTSLLEIRQALRKHKGTCGRCRKSQPCGARDWMRLKLDETSAEHDRQIRIADLANGRECVQHDTAPRRQRELISQG
jgi:hypothetical protein